MLFWLIFIFLIILCFADYRVGENRKPKWVIYLGYLFLIFVSCFRFDVGWDYPNYFETIWPTLNIESISILEPGSQGIILLAYYLGSPVYIFLIYALLTLLLIFISFAKFSKNLFISILIYITFFYLSSLSTIRQGLALAIIMYCIHYLFNLKYIKYIGGCIIAMMFHSSALVAILFLPLYILSNRKTLFPIYIGTLISFLFLFKLVVSLIFPRYVSYILNLDEYSGGNLVMIFMVILVTTLLYIVYKYGRVIDYKLIIIPMIGCILPFVFGGHIGGRISSYFIVPICYIIPNILSYRSANLIFKPFVFICVVYFMLNIYIDSMNPVKTQYIPYKIVFNQNLNSPNFKR